MVISHMSKVIIDVPMYGLIYTDYIKATTTYILCDVICYSRLFSY